MVLNDTLTFVNWGKTILFRLHVHIGLKKLSPPLQGAVKAILGSAVPTAIKRSRLILMALNPCAV